MRLTIERFKDGDTKFVIESHVIKDMTGNEWLLEVTNNKVYITYEGKLANRVASLKVISTNGQEFRSTHDNVFASKNNSFESYYWLRSIIKKNETSDVWNGIQEGLLKNPLNIHVNV